MRFFQERLSGVNGRYHPLHLRKCAPEKMPNVHSPVMKTKRNKTKRKKYDTEIKGCLWLTRGLLSTLESTSNSLLVLVCQNMGHIVQNLSHNATL